MRSEITGKIDKNSDKSPKFQHFYVKSMLLRKMIISDFGPEVEILPPLRMFNDKMVKITRKCIFIDQISHLF